MFVTKASARSGSSPEKAWACRIFGRNLCTLAAENSGRYVRRRYLDGVYKLETRFWPSARAAVHKDAFFIAYTAEIPTDNMTLTPALSNF